MTRVVMNHKTWTETGKKAAEAGKNGAALYAVCVLFDLFFTFLTTIIDTQFELHRAITAANNTPAKH